VAKILLSEDDPDVAKLLLILLANLGHDATALEAGADVPTSADLLILEPASPIRLEHAEAARRRDPSLPILSLSYLHQDALFLADGPLVHVRKPFTVARLTDAIELALKA
jgi:CheY-like chemotaxis protein